MDRFLGEVLANPHVATLNDRGVLTYQWGRKDPFPMAIPLYNIQGMQLAATAPTNFVAQKWVNTANLTSGLTMATSIQYPMSLSSNWQGVNSANYRWNDAQVVVTNLMTKPIYDPCPPGWYVPDYRFLEELQRYTEVAIITSGQGFKYIPIGGYLQAGEVIWYQYNGSRLYVGITYNPGWGNHTQINSSTPDGANNYIELQRTDVGGNYYNRSYERSGSAAVRCVSMTPKP